MNTYTASDHNAILWEILNVQSPRRPKKQLNTIGWKVKTLDPSALLVALNSDQIIAGCAEEKTKDLMKRVIQACDASMSRRRSMNTRLSVHWWNDHISALREECHQKRRICQRSYRRTNSVELVAEYKKARRELNKAIKENKRRCWKELIYEVDKDVWGRPYKVVMTHLKKQQMPSPTCPQLLQKIVTALFPQQRNFDYQLAPGELDDIPPVTEEELLEACNRVGNNKAPGLDGIPNLALKTIIKAALTLFLDAYNACLKEGTFPRKWKQQRLVLLPKGKKPPEEPSSYRPLCMLDTAGKIFERIIHQRINAVVDPLLADNQYGFRKGRSTLDAIKLVVDTAKEAIAGTRWKGGTKEYCLVATLDIRNAFNSANWECIMQALQEKNAPEYLLTIVTSYFENRVLKYDTKNGPREYDITGGVPQGSVLGPLLWNIMYDGLLRLTLPGNVKLVAYADDVTESKRNK
ncbi:GSCOCG00012408001-RA-CDS [Cotesia congregata]|nr:GSCOCG00012408001-RA-CDS [Cotesia congregata]